MLPQTGPGVSFKSCPTEIKHRHRLGAKPRTWTGHQFPEQTNQDIGTVALARSYWGNGVSQTIPFSRADLLVWVYMGCIIGWHMPAPGTRLY